MNKATDAKNKVTDTTSEPLPSDEHPVEAYSSEAYIHAERDNCGGRCGCKPAASRKSPRSATYLTMRSWMIPS